ncbi:MAG: hypothetical protein WAK50_09910 [Nitrososphaeraceae archaeon]|jgi:hypothetical protein
MLLDTKYRDLFHSTNTQENRKKRDIDDIGGRIESEEHINKQYSGGIGRLKNAHQFAGKTFIVISQEIVNKLCINQDTWFREDITGNAITLTITQWKENWGLKE